MAAFEAYFVLWLMPEKPEFREGADAFMPNGLTVEEASTLNPLDFFVKLSEMFAAQFLAEKGNQS